MTTLLTILLLIAGFGLVLYGLAFGIVFVVARRIFDRALRSEVAASGTALVEGVLARIRSPALQRVLTPKLRQAAGAVTVAVVRKALSGRARLGFGLAGLGLALLVAAFYVPEWLSAPK